MEFNLTEQLLQLKESEGNECKASSLSFDAARQDLDGSLDRMYAAKSMIMVDIIDKLEDSTDAISQDELFEKMKCLVSSMDLLQPFDQNRIFDILMNALKNLSKETKIAIEMENMSDTKLRSNWEHAMFLTYWFALVTERKATAKTNLQSTTVISNKKKSKKSSAQEMDDDVFDWHLKKIFLVRQLNSVLALPLTKIWSLMHERAPFIRLFVDQANLMLETESNLKMSELKKEILELLCVCAQRYGQAQEFQTMIMQNLRYSTHLADFMAEFLTLVAERDSVPELITALFQEIGKNEFQADDKTAKEFSKFLIAFSNSSPRNILKNFSYITDLTDSESFTVRSAMIEVIGSMLAHMSLNFDDELSKTQVNNFCMVVEERSRDVSSFVRAKLGIAAAVFSPIDCSTNVKTDGLERQRNLIPLLRRPKIIDAAIERLNDKTAAVRKEAIKFLSKCVETHPFWLDGGLLDAGLLEQKRSELHRKIEDNFPKDDFMQELADSLPMEAKNAMKKDQMLSVNITTSEEDVKKTLSTEELDMVQSQIAYYNDALKFINQIEKSIPVLTELLASKSKSDVLEAISFFVETHRHGIAQSTIGLRRMVHLIWSKDVGDNEMKSIKEYLLQAYYEIYINVGGESEKERAKKIVRNLIILTFGSSLADITSIEQLLSVMMSRKMIDEHVIHHLWSVYGSSTELPHEQRRGSIIIIGMLAKDTPEILLDKIPLLIKIGFGKYGKEDILTARYTCAALQKLGYVKKMKNANQVQRDRLSNDHQVFQRLKRMVSERYDSLDWFSFCEQAINLVYGLAEKPESICNSILRKLTYITFPSVKQNLSTADDIGASQASESHFETPSEPTAMDFARLLFVIGHVAIKEIAHLEIVESELKGRDGKDTKKVKKDETSEELNQVVGTVEDEVADDIHYIREKELLYGPDSLLASYGDLVVHICSNNNSFKNPLIRRMGVLALCKLMCISEKFCEQNLNLLFNILENAKDSSTRSNVIVGIGDLAVCFNNLIDQNISHLYKRLRDKNVEVKKNALMVLTHLILNGMVKVKGQISEMALCLEDEEQKISDLAKLFFSELSTKENAIYNNLTDIISNLSSKNEELDEKKFQNITKFLFTFIEKDRQTDNIIEKLCHRFKDAESPRLWRDLSFCLSLLQIKSEKSLKRLYESLPLYQDKLGDEVVFVYFTEIIAKSRKHMKTDLLLDELEKRIIDLHKSGKSSAETLQNAASASQTFNDWNKLKPSNAIEEAKTALENLKISGTPVKKKKVATKVATKKKPRKRLGIDHEDDENEEDENWHNSNVMLE